MTVTATTTPREVLAPRAVSVARGYRFELVKLLAHWRVRILIGLCWIGPAVTVVEALPFASVTTVCSPIPGASNIARSRARSSPCQSR